MDGRRIELYANPEQRCWQRCDHFAFNTTDHSSLWIDDFGGAFRQLTPYRSHVCHHVTAGRTEIGSLFHISDFCLDGKKNDCWQRRPDSRSWNPSRKMYFSRPSRLEKARKGASTAECNSYGNDQVDNGFSYLGDTGVGRDWRICQWWKLETDWGREGEGVTNVKMWKFYQKLRFSSFNRPPNFSKF